MDIPDPTPGLVIRYSYLWHDESLRGADEGRKDRPCVVVLAVEHADGGKRVALVPITHTPPRTEQDGIAIETATAERVGLDKQPQWIVTHDANIFTWPGFDIRVIPGHHPPDVVYGSIPHGLMKLLVAAVLQNVRQGKAKPVERD